jgi:hypothetical protein
MYKALVFKELRETIGIAAIALLAYFIGVMNLIQYSFFPLVMFLPIRRGDIPFYQDQFTTWFSFVSIGFAIALGLKQTVGESWRGTWLLLLHRTLNRRNVIAAKLAVGTVVYLLVSAVPILVYALWAATPGTHPSPFCWWMTVPSWMAWLIITMCYYAAFLTGLRPGRWLGTRMLPLAAIALLAMPITFIPHWWILGLPVLILACAFLINMTFYVLRTRDYS